MHRQLISLLCTLLLAQAQEELGDAPAAAHALERAIANLRGPDRAPPLVHLARLLEGPLEDPGRAEDLFRLALSDDPEKNRLTLERMPICRGALLAKVAALLCNGTNAPADRANRAREATVNFMVLGILDV